MCGRSWSEARHEPRLATVIEYPLWTSQTEAVSASLFSCRHKHVTLASSFHNFPQLYQQTLLQIVIGARWECGSQRGMHMQWTPWTLGCQDRSRRLATEGHSQREPPVLVESVSLHPTRFETFREDSPKVGTKTQTLGTNQMVRPAHPTDYAALC